MDKDQIFNIGQKLTIKEDLEQETCFGNKKIRKKGTPLFVGADSHINALHYLNDDIQIIQDDAEIKGYSVTGISEWIYEKLRYRLPINDMLEDYDETPEKLKECIADALEELGMYDHTGNRN